MIFSSSLQACWRKNNSENSTQYQSHYLYSTSNKSVCAPRLYEVVGLKSNVTVCKIA